MQKQDGKTVIHVVQRLAPGGLEAMVLDMLVSCQPAHKVTIVSLEGNKDDSLKAWPRLTPFSDQLIFLEKPPGVRLSLIWKLSKLFSLLKPDVVHSHHIGPLLYAGLAAKTAGVPVHIHTEHDSWHLSDPKRRKVQALALKLSQPTLVADADQVLLQIKRHFQYRQVSVIKNGIDCRKFAPGPQHRARQELGLPQKACLIGTAGRLEHVKGHDTLIAALRFLPRRVGLVIAGDGSQRHQLYALARKLGVEKRVKFLGQTDDMPRFYQSLNLFCLPSRNEGFPLSPLEAQACNVRTLVTDTGASRETLCPISGGVVRPEKPLEMAFMIERMLRRHCLQKPREFVLENNTIQKMSASYQALFNGV